MKPFIHETADRQNMHKCVFDVNAVLAIVTFSIFIMVFCCRHIAITHPNVKRKPSLTSSLTK